MNRNDFIFSIVDQYKYPIVFVDNEHVIRYMNHAAMGKYAKRGGGKLLNQSVLDCHTPASKEMILGYHERFKAGENEFFLTVNKQGQKVWMVAVRDGDGVLLGYYERFED